MKTQDGQRKANVTSRALVLAMALAVTVGAQAAGVPGYQQACTDAWADAPAGDVCTGGSLTWIGATDSLITPTGTCSVRGIECTVTATMLSGDEKSWRLNPMWQEYSPATTLTLDVCFAEVTEVATETVVDHKAHIRAGCNTGETVSADMQGSTLSY